MSETIIKAGSQRYTVFPIKHNNLWNFYKTHASTIWFVEEVLLTDDLLDWNNKLNDSERFFIKNILAFFAASDGIVNENLVLNFYNEVQIPEARSFYTMQMLIESVHSEMYSLLIDTYITNKQEQEHLFNAIETIPAVKRKADWALKWISEGATVIESIPSDTFNKIKSLENDGVSGLEFFTKNRPSFAQRLLAFICIEGIFFSGSFCAIYWLKSRGLMPGLSTSNNFISRDENLHAEFAIELYKMLDNKLDTDTVHSIFKDAVNIEKEFITESLPVSLLGMNCDLMKIYIEYIADRWLVLLDYPKIFNVENPFNFMEMLSVAGKENFFETRVSSYKRGGIGQSEEERKLDFNTLDDDF